MSAQNFYNLRVYAIIKNSRNEVLVSDEFHFGEKFTKFPGGGLEFGEGLKDCLKREFMEEFQMEIDVQNIFYVNDFLQISAFNENAQLFSFYYNASFVGEEEFHTATERQFPVKEGEKLRWIPISNIQPEMMRFPIDQLIVKKLKEEGK